MSDQEKAFDKLSRLKVGALFMEMGTGKTKVALDLIASRASKIAYVLWICPFSIKGEIEAEREKWHPEIEMEIVGCETIGSSAKSYLEVFRKVRSNPSFVVVDESLKIKNAKAKRTQRILGIGEFAKYKLILNGTPISKNVLDLYPQMQFLSPKILNMTYQTFMDRYCEYYVRGRLKRMVKKQHNVENLISIIRPYIFDSELDLGKSKRRHEIGYSIEDTAKYEAIKDSFRGRQDGVEFFAIATSLQHCYCSSEIKKLAVEKLASSIVGQCVVFVKYIESIPKGAEKVIGESSEKERKETLRRFKEGEFKTLYITYGCGSYGLNLQNCSNAIFADHTFDYAERLQAEARIYRMGQESDVDYWSFDCACGLDRLIRGCIDKKVRLSDEIKKEIEKGKLKEIIESL